MSASITRLTVRALAAGSVITLSVAADAAHAQAGQAAQDGGPTVVEDTGGNTQLEQIVVTSQRRPQLLQKVPISVTAFSSEAIKWNQI